MSDPGIIPAYAGSTADYFVDNCADYGSSPHTRGAPALRLNQTACIGDHPRIRGEHVPARHPLGCLRGIIPAYAGSTQGTSARRQPLVGSSPHTRGAPASTCRTTTSRRDHPRIRGEHRPERDGGAGHPGIIPAYAGSTFSVFAIQKSASGSSPHTRGALRAGRPH